MMILFFLVSSLFAKEYCLSMSDSLSKAKTELEKILLPENRIILDQNLNCLKIENLTAKKEELVESFLSQKFSLRTKPSLDWAPPSFRLELVKTKKSKSETNQIIRVKNTEGEGKTTSTMMVMSGRKSQLEYDKDVLDVVLYKRGDNVEAEFSYKGPAGGVTTSLMLSLGEKINVGKIVKELKEKDRTLGLPKGIQYSKTEGEEQTEFFLTVFSDGK